MTEYFSQMIPASHPIIAGHSVFGQPLLPGLAYIDLLYQMASQAKGIDFQHYALKRLAIDQPLAVNKHQSLCLGFSFDGETPPWKITVAAEEEEDRRQRPLADKRYMSAQFHKTAPLDQKRIDLEDLQKQGGERVDLARVYAEAAQRGLVHTGMIKAGGTLLPGRDECLIEVWVDEPFQSSAEDFLFHPTLIDGAAMAAGFWAAHQAGHHGGELYLPLYYDSFRCAAPLRSHCFALVRAARCRRTAELLVMDIDFYDKNGLRLAHLHKLTAKRLRDTDRLTSKHSTTAAGSAGPLSRSEPITRRQDTGDHHLPSPPMPIESLLRRIFAHRLGKEAWQIDLDAGFYELGLVSSQLMSVMQEIEETFGLSLAPTLLFEQNNLQELIDYLGRKKQDNEQGREPSSPPSPAGSQTVERQRPLPIAGTALPAMDIAIISMAGRYPGAATLEEFRDNLRQGKDCIGPIPEERWDHSLYFDPHKCKSGKAYSRWGGFLKDIDQFDPLFFKISPREAELMDPQERLFLETVWVLLENSGITRAALQQRYGGAVGVWVGSMYQHYHAFANDPLSRAAVSLSSYSSIANRVSYFYNFQGPSLAVDCMCSSSLAAVHMACESLRRQECAMAIAGGVNLTLHPKKYLGLSLSQMIGSHPHSRSFGDGDGYLPAEGVGAVMLKPVELAEEEGDEILGVIRSSLMNHGGRSSGYSVPNVKAQAGLIRQNFQRAGVEPRSISYVEAAANGSALGDPIEIEALSQVFASQTEERQYCAIGSVKSNIGHAEAASGISQLSKVLLQLQDRTIYGSVQTPASNPHIRFEETPFDPVSECREWQRPLVTMDGREQEFPRRATVSSFGAGGTNVHMIVEEYTAGQPPAPEPRSSEIHLVVLSAAKNDRVPVMVRQLLEFVQKRPDLSLSDLAYTLQVGREAMAHRMALLARDRQQLIEGLQRYLAPDQKENGKERPASLYTGKAGAPGADEREKAHTLVIEGDMKKLASFWVTGANVPWELLYKKGRPRTIILPNYPFERRRCWIPQPAQPETADTRQPGFVGLEVGTEPAAEGSLDLRITEIICELLGVTAEEIDPLVPLTEYGFDSMRAMQLLYHLQSRVSPSFDAAKLKQCCTVRDIIEAAPVDPSPVPKTDERQSDGQHFTRKSWPQFPELIALNQADQGRPIFWIHGGVGGVETYQAVASRLRRPFYGIQARGWMTDRAPLHGMQAMAAYYLHIIMAVQPQGPYDLGGYSLGGDLAYEICRQLQELGSAVNSVVMVDSLDSRSLQKMEVCSKTSILQIVNTALAAMHWPEAQRLDRILIHRDQLDISLNEDDFLKQVIGLAMQQGGTQTEKQWQSQVEHNVRVQQAYDVVHFSIMPLPDPQAVTCSYFRNRSGVFYGDLEPYFTTRSKQFPLDHTEYWQEWQERFTTLQMVEVDSANHLTMLSDSQARQVIMRECEALYSS